MTNFRQIWRKILFFNENLKNKCLKIKIFDQEFYPKTLTRTKYFSAKNFRRNIFGQVLFGKNNSAKVSRKHLTYGVYFKLIISVDICNNCFFFIFYKITSCLYFVIAPSSYHNSLLNIFLRSNKIFAKQQN